MGTAWGSAAGEGFRLILGAMEGNEMVGGTLGSPETVSGAAKGGILAVPPRREDCSAAGGERDVSTPGRNAGSAPLPTAGMEWWALIEVTFPWVPGGGGSEDGRSGGETEEDESGGRDVEEGGGWWCMLVWNGALTEPTPALVYNHTRLLE